MTSNSLTFAYECSLLGTYVLRFLTTFLTTFLAITGICKGFLSNLLLEAHGGYLGAQRHFSADLASETWGTRQVRIYISFLHSSF